MSPAFLTTSAGPAAPLARSPMEHAAAAAGARFAARDGWNVAVGYGDAGDGARRPVLWADASHIGKLELAAPLGGAEAIARAVAALTGGGEVRPGGAALRAAGAWWCPVTPERVLVLADPGGLGALLAAAREQATGAARLTDVTTTFAALAVSGPQARETIARFCALDLRPHVTPVAAFRPGSVARTPGFVLREAGDRYLLIVGAAVAHYVWTVVADAATHLGGAPAPLDALEPPAQDGAHA
jgi:heterotetrameric sarcosine oxidase gamma subunit